MKWFASRKEKGVVVAFFCSSFLAQLYSDTDSPARIPSHFDCTFGFINLSLDPLHVSYLTFCMESNRKGSISRLHARRCFYLWLVIFFSSSFFHKSLVVCRHVCVEEWAHPKSEMIRMMRTNAKHAFYFVCNRKLDSSVTFNSTRKVCVLLKISILLVKISLFCLCCVCVCVCLPSKSCLLLSVG